MAIDDDSEILDLSAEVCRLAAAADAIDGERISPFDNEYHRIIREPGIVTAESLERGNAFRAANGVEAALREQEQLFGPADRAFERMMSIKATTQPGRVAKVRALLVHVLGGDWRGPSDELECDNRMARALLAEFAGMGEEEVGAI